MTFPLTYMAVATFIQAVAAQTGVASKSSVRLTEQICQIHTLTLEKGGAASLVSVSGSDLWMP